MADVNLLAPKILLWEGGYEVDPRDAGAYNHLGALVGSNMGITPNTYERVIGHSPSAQEMKDLSLSQFTKILKTMFWDDCKADLIQDQQVANVFVDFAWGSGLDDTIKIVQALVGVLADGDVGPITLKAINSANPQILTNDIVFSRIKFYNQIVKYHPPWQVFLSGWVRRANFYMYKVPT